MLESDADRLASIKGLGGQLVRNDQGDEFFAIFDSYYQAALDDVSVESQGPALSACRTSDLEANAVRKGVDLTVAGQVFKVRRVQAQRAPGWSTVLLSKVA